MRFAIVSYFDTTTTEKIRSVQEKLFDITGSRGSLDIWEPHITVGAGVDVPDEKLDVFNEQLSSVASHHKSFRLELKDYGYMNNWNPGSLEGYTTFVIFIDVLLNDNLLALVDDIERDVTNNYSLYYGQLKPYAPHITVAFKDLSEEGFEKAKSMLSEENISISSTIDHIAIAAEDVNEKWSQTQKFELK